MTAAIAPLQEFEENFRRRLPNKLIAGLVMLACFVLAAALASMAPERGGTWIDPGAEWDKMLAAIEAWQPDRNTGPTRWRNSSRSIAIPNRY